MITQWTIEKAYFFHDVESFFLFQGSIVSSFFINEQVYIVELM